MRLGIFRRRRNAFRVALTVFLALLLQQMAMAGYACPLTEMPAEQQAMMAECKGMEMEDSPMLCEKHCNPDNSTAPDFKAASVPPVGLPPPRFEFPHSLIPPTSARDYENVRLCQSDPPPLLRFCSLQI